MREGWTSGTMAASLIRPMRRPLRSKTGIETSSVKYRRLFRHRKRPGARHLSATRGQLATLVLECALHGFTDATSTMAHRDRTVATKKSAAITRVPGSRLVLGILFLRPVLPPSLEGPRPPSEPRISPSRWTILACFRHVEPDCTPRRGVRHGHIRQRIARITVEAAEMPTPASPGPTSFDATPAGAILTRRANSRTMRASAWPRSKADPGAPGRRRATAGRRRRPRLGEHAVSLRAAPGGLGYQWPTSAHNGTVRYLALLRGINVGGRNIVPMHQLLGASSRI